MNPEEFLANPPDSIIQYPNPILTTVCKPITDITPWRDILAIMYELMERFHGCGLAAPQVGLPYRAFITKVKSNLNFINPEILEYGERTDTEKEGCLSIPEFHALITRPRKVKIRWTELNGKTRTAMFEGHTARVILHENDHLNGKLIIETANKQ